MIILGTGMEWGGVGWGGDNTKRVSCYATWSSPAFDAPLHLHLHLMLRYMIFRCLWCYATWSSRALDARPSLALDATLQDLHLHLMPRYMIFTWDATLHLHLHFHRWGSGWGGDGDNTKPVSCYATWSSLAFDATSNSKKQLGEKSQAPSDMVKTE